MTHCLRVGVGGPVGSGKTALLKQLCSADDLVERARAHRRQQLAHFVGHTQEVRELLAAVGARSPPPAARALRGPHPGER